MIEPAKLNAIREYFLEDPSRMTMMAARKFEISEQAVLHALVGQWPILALRPDSFLALMDELPSLGLMRVFVRSRVAVIESVGIFGGYSQTGPFFNVQTDTLDMHLFPKEVASIYSVEKTGHDSTFATHSFQFFDQDGNAGFKAFLWESFPDVPVSTIARFHDIARSFSVATDETL